jgi:hypothetical protein
VNSTAQASHPFGASDSLQPNAKVERRAATLQLAVYSRRFRSNES